MCIRFLSSPHALLCVLLLSSSLPFFSTHPSILDNEKSFSFYLIMLLQKKKKSFRSCLCCVFFFSAWRDITRRRCQRGGKMNTHYAASLFFFFFLGLAVLCWPKAGPEKNVRYFYSRNYYFGYYT